MTIPWFTANAAITVSADGKLIYVALGSTVLVVQSDSLTTVNELVYQHTQPVAVSPDNKLVAILGGELNILRTSDYSLLFTDTVEYEYKDGVFSHDSRTFYCASRRNLDSSEVVFKADLSDSLFPVTKKGFAYGAVTQVVPSPDETKLFLYLAVGLWTYIFEVYDVSLDSIIFRDVLVPGAGSLAISPDGMNVFYTSPGRTSTDPPPDPTFKIFNVEMNRVVEVVRDSSFFCTGQGCFPLDSSQLLPMVAGWEL